MRADDREELSSFPVHYKHGRNASESRKTVSNVIDGDLLDSWTERKASRCGRLGSVSEAKRRPRGTQVIIIRTDSHTKIIARSPSPPVTHHSAINHRNVTTSRGNEDTAGCIRDGEGVDWMAETEDAVEGFDSCYVRLRAAFMISSQYSNNSNVVTANAWKTATHGHRLQVLCQKLLTFTDTYVVITFKSEAQSNVLPVFFTEWLTTPL